jgi:hypothetical protein
MPRGASAGLERHAGGKNARRLWSINQRVDTNVAREVLIGTFS